MNGFALFRRPYGATVTWMEGEVEELPSCMALSGRQGFVMAPFAVSVDEPVLLIHPQHEKTFPVTDREWTVPQMASVGKPLSDAMTRQHYTADFNNFHDHLLNGDFSKLVLSRCARERKDSTCTPASMFWQACDNYPRLFIALVYTPQSGLWLVATPEVLLEGDGRQWHTMALAGTVQLSDDQLQQDVPVIDWSIKNIQEQRYVATYIMECLQHFTNDIREEGPRTARAANLVHLRSDFTFTLSCHDHLGELLQVLHPTPAVCGLPKHEAYQFILSNEHSQRHYYSGFMGPLQPDAETHLYVSLRCMNIVDDDCYLYAGGGLLRESIEPMEWMETEAKLGTMRRLIHS